MLRTLTSVENYKVVANDGEIGAVVGFLLDDEHWVVRYLVVETGGFVGGRRVLISPISFRSGLLPSRRLQVGLTIDKVQYGPNIDPGEPVSRQQELEYHRYFGYARYWGYSGLWGAGSQPSALAKGRRDDVSVDEGAQQTSEVHVRTAADLRGYDVRGSDGVLGHVADFVVDEDTWAVRYFVLDTQPWRVGQDVLLAREWTKPTEARTLQVEMSQPAIEASPRWNQAATVDREYEALLYAHYGRPAYWEPTASPSQRSELSAS